MEYTDHVHAQRGKWVLLVEDDESYAALISDALAKEDIAVEVAKSGEEALEKAKGEPDLILLDYVLPDMNGVEVLKKVRSQNSMWSKKVSVYILTQKHDLSTMAEAIEGHMDGYIVKAGVELSSVLEVARRELM